MNETWTYYDDFPSAPGVSAWGWAMESVGAFWLVTLVLVTLVAVGLALTVLIRGRGPFASAAVVLASVTPLVLALFAGLMRAISTYLTVAASSSVPRPGDLYAGYAAGLMIVAAGALLTIGVMAVTLVGSVIRAIGADEGPSPEGPTRPTRSAERGLRPIPERGSAQNTDPSP